MPLPFEVSIHVWPESPRPDFKTGVVPVLQIVLDDARGARYWSGVMATAITLFPSRET
jgi:hypothetical protein